MPCVCLSLLHLYAPPILIICLYPRFTHSSTFNYIIFVLMKVLKAFVRFDFDFVIASARFNLPLIHLTFAISLHLYAWQRHIMLIINRFSCVVPNLIKHLYNNFEFVYKTSGRSILSILSIIDLTKALILKPWAIPYSFKANTLLVTLLHLIKD